MTDLKSKVLPFCAECKQEQSDPLHCPDWLEHDFVPCVRLSDAEAYAEQRVKEVDDVLLDVLNQACWEKDERGNGIYDTCCLSAYERGAYYLVKRGLLRWESKQSEGRIAVEVEKQAGAKKV